MSRLRIWGVLCLLGLLLPVPVVFGQDGDPSAEDAATDNPFTAESDEEIDALLEGDESLFSGTESYTYEPAGRRDPFRSLIRTSETTVPEGPRPEGIPGLLIDEVTLIGILRTPDGYVAQVQAADQQKSYLIREGDELFDGEVVSVDRGEVVFRQRVQDPAALKPFRDLVKTLSP